MSICSVVNKVIAKYKFNEPVIYMDWESKYLYNPPLSYYTTFVYYDKKAYIFLDDQNNKPITRYSGSVELIKKIEHHYLKLHKAVKLK